jgi:hypothetical protein
MVDSSKYYHRDPRELDAALLGRVPRNHVKYPVFLKPLEWIDGAYGLFGSHAFKIKASLLKEYDSAAPLDDYLGTKDELERTRQSVVSYCEGIDSNPFLSPVGRFLLKKISLNWLENRKKVLRFYHSNRKYIETNGKFKNPVIITGLPRSGTTLLQRLMSEDPNTRSPYTYEMELSTPPLTADRDPMRDPRIKVSGASMSTLASFAPGLIEKFAESHLWSPTEKEESLIYMFHHNSVPVMNFPTAGRAYAEELFSLEGKRALFRYERLFFTMLDAYRPARTHWTLKAPNYATLFPTLFEEYPDARVVLTHRNPLVTLPSICRLMESWCIAFDREGSFDKHRFGQILKMLVDKCLLVPLQYRKEHPEKEERIFDCAYDDLFSDPILMVKKIYQYFDLEYSHEFDARMKAYLKNNQQGKYGRHRYSLEEYGFDAKNLYNEYGEYMDRFGFGIPTDKERPASFHFSLT